MSDDTELENDSTEEVQSENTGESETESPDNVKDRLLRLAAEFENYRKRVQKEKADYVQYANENVIRELLPVLDNFDLAVGHLDQTSDVKSLAEGVKMIFSQLQSTLERFGVRSESAKGKTFDPLLHEALGYIDSEQPEHTVVQEMQKAYFLNQRLLRPARVMVSKGPFARTAETPANLADETQPVEGNDSDPHEKDDSN